jgi:hypothetical protein
MWWAAALLSRAEADAFLGFADMTKRRRFRRRDGRCHEPDRHRQSADEHPHETTILYLNPYFR